MRSLYTINPDSLHNVNANVWLGRDFTSPIANGYNDLIKDKLKMSRKHISLSLKIFFLMVALLKYTVLMLTCKSYSKKKTRKFINASHPYFSDWPWHTTNLVF